MVQISVIGTGYVGLVSGACLADFGNFVTCIDNNAEKIQSLHRGTIPIYEPGLEDLVDRNVKAGRLFFTTALDEAVRKSRAVFIAVGTPPQEDGGADLSYVEEAARSIGRVIENHTVVVDKSTVPIGTARRVRHWVQEELSRRGVTTDFDVVSNPEFLREGTAVYDFTHPDRVVIGSENEKALGLMKEIYRSLYLNETPFIETNLESAEMIKYASNAFLAVKITFINEVANLCEKTGADVQDVARAMGRDGRIGGKFLHPGPGYGGSCFPKDTRAMAKTGRDHGEVLSLVETTIAANERQKKKMIEKIEAGLGGPGSLSGKTLAILGLAFKQNTDDMRESPAIDICLGLAEKGAGLRLSDPAAFTEAKWRLSGIDRCCFYAENEYQAAEGSWAIAILTPWNQYRNLDLTRIKALLSLSGEANPCFFDLRNIYKRKEVEAAGLRYFGVGRSS
ncbi:MAG: UDP-glucose/GDP-mannose dehydrogenase family protein [Spirochaetaceae bacterium]|jgi:UDPglucose 6-dehydrogenase|nr:UDP-glucose/GDP-mannose dehydrogenase family protein [Spirochaetaceae bacterium]